MKRAFRTQAAVDLIGADVQETRHAVLPAGLHHAPCAFDVGAHKRGAVLDAPVHVAFGGKVHYRVATRRDFIYRGIANVQSHKLESRIPCRAVEVSQIARVRQFIGNDNARIRVFRQHVMNKIRPDEARSAGDENFHAVSLYLRRK